MGRLVGTLKTGDIVVLKSVKQTEKKSYSLYGDKKPQTEEKTYEKPMFVINIYDSPFVINCGNTKTDLIPLSALGNEITGVLSNWAFDQETGADMVGKILTNLHITSGIEDSIYQQLLASTKKNIEVRTILTILKMIGLNIQLTYKDIEDGFSVMSLLNMGAGFFPSNVLVNDGNTE